ncbi:MAG: hypothetical protein M0R32_06000 [Candidatus Cloacimonetes bacterium]|jgi:hypothetical protein|nr:hypothetical protein [Candidatus Cloacimonadota bacterium]
MTTLDENYNKSIKALEKVIATWGVGKCIICLLLIPYSLLYVTFRMGQEWNGEKDEKAK